MNRHHAALARLGALAAVLLCLAGCKEESSSNPSGSDKAVDPADDKAAIDPSLGAAIAATSASAGHPAAAVAQDPNAPPQSGVFDPGRADATHASGAPVHIEVGSTGSEPKVQLRPAQPALPASLEFTVATRTGVRNALPTVDLTLSFKVDKPKKPAADKPAEPSVVPATAKLARVGLSSEQPGQLGPGVQDEIAKMKGSVLQLGLAPTGGVQSVSIELAKTATPELEHVLAGAVDALAAFDVAAPADPVGVGAAWIARNRESYGGLDVVVYRMYRITAIEGDDVKLSVEVRMYASGPNVRKPGMPPGTLKQMEALGQGELVIKKGSSVAHEGTLQQRLMLGLEPQGQPAQDGQLLPVLMQTQIEMKKASK